MLSATLALVSDRTTLQSSTIPTPIQGPYLLRWVDAKTHTRVQLAYDNEAQRDAHALAVIIRGVAVAVAVTVTLAYARGAA